MLTHLHFQSHGNWFEGGHTLVDVLGAQSEFASHDGANDGVLDGSIVDEWDGEAVLFTFIYIGDDGHALLLLDALHIERSLGVLLRPEEFLALEILILGDGLGNQLVVAIIDDGLCIVEENQFLSALLLHRREVLLMGSAYIGEHGDGRLDDVTKGKHLARLTDSRLEHAHLGLLVHQPY